MIFTHKIEILTIVRADGNADPPLTVSKRRPGTLRARRQVNYNRPLSINRVLPMNTARAMWAPGFTGSAGSSVRGSKNSI